MRHLALLVILVVGCRSEGPGGSLEVDMRTVMLSGPGATYRLTATGGGAIGWESDDPAVVAVDAGGTVTAVAASGSAHIYAVRGETRSAPALVYVARPRPNAVVVEEEQFVSGPELVAPSPDDDTILGAQVSVVLTGLDAPAAGTILVPRGRSPVAGRVVGASVSPDGDVEVVLEVVCATELFEELSLRSRGTLISSEGEREDGARLQETVSEFDLGVFECKLDATVGTIETPAFSQSLSADLDYELDVVIVDGVLQHMLLKADGALAATALGKLELKEKIDATLTCEWTFAKAIIPAPGWLSLIASLEVPLGFGFEVKASLEATLFEVSLEGELAADVAAGFSWDEQNGFQDLSSFEITKKELTPKFDAPSGLADAAKIGVSARVYGFVRPQATLTVPFLEIASVQLVKFDAGLKQSANLALPAGQAPDPSYASAYDLAIDGTVEAGKHIKKFLELIGLDKAFVLKKEGSLRIATSPTGELSFDPPEVKAGQGTWVTVTFDADTTEYVGVENLDQIRVYTVREDGTLELHDFAAASDNEAKYLWTPTADEQAEPPTFVAFVVTDLLLGVPLEIEQDSAVTPPPAFDAGDILTHNGVFVDSATASATEFQPVVGADEVVWSPDGTKLAFVGAEAGVVNVYVAAPDASGLQKLTNYGVNSAVTWPIWSPDGTKIAYFAQKDLHVVDANGANDVKVNVDIAYAKFATWSPDSKRLVFSGLADGNTTYAIHVVDADGGNLEKISSYYATSIAWSPGGGKIAFVGREVFDGSANDLFTIEPDGFGVKKLTDWEDERPHSEAHGLSWSPDGSKIYFVSTQGAGAGLFDIHVVNADGSGRTNLTNTPGLHEYCFGVSAQTGRVAYSRTGAAGGIYYLEPDGGIPFLVATSEAIPLGCPRWRPGK